MRRLALGSKRGLPETLTFCFGHERWCFWFAQREFQFAVQSVLSITYIYFFCLFFPCFWKKITSNQEEVGWDKVSSYSRTLIIFLRACISVTAFLFSVNNLFHWASSTNAELKWLEVVFTLLCVRWKKWVLKGQGQKHLTLLRKQLIRAKLL